MVELKIFKGLTPLKQRKDGDKNFDNNQHNSENRDLPNRISLK